MVKPLGPHASSVPALRNQFLRKDLGFAATARLQHAVPEKVPARKAKAPRTIRGAFVEIGRDA